MVKFETLKNNENFFVIDYDRKKLLIMFLMTYVRMFEINDIGKISQNLKYGKYPA